MENKNHQAFCDEYLINGMNAALAYRSVYKTAVSIEASEVSACRLLSNDKVKLYISAAQQASTIKAGITREELIEDLIKIKDDCKAKGVFTTHALKAIDMLCKMQGFNAPDKSEVTHKGITINYNKPNED